MVISLFDPLGFVALATKQGRSLLRKLTIKETNWDAERNVLSGNCGKIS